MKLLYTVITLSLLYLFIGNTTKEQIIIPDDSMRLRIIANSNSTYDQAIKLKVKKNLEIKISNILSNVKDLAEAKQILEDNIDILNENVKMTLDSENYLKPYTLSLGKNYFPEKEFYGVKYNSGLYESLVVTIGEGNGNNWWCVLFPPLCLIEAEESTEVEYHFYIKDILQKYL